MDTDLDRTVRRTLAAGYGAAGVLSAAIPLLVDGTAAPPALPALLVISMLALSYAFWTGRAAAWFAIAFGGVAAAIAMLLLSQPSALLAYQRPLAAAVGIAVLPGIAFFVYQWSRRSKS